MGAMRLLNLASSPVLPDAAVSSQRKIRPMSGSFLSPITPQEPISFRSPVPKDLGHTL